MGLLRKAKICQTGPMRTLSLVLLVLTSLSGCARDVAASNPADAAKATFAGGCFWCMEPPFDKVDGVFSTTSGYAGGQRNTGGSAEACARPTHGTFLARLMDRSAGGRKGP